MGGFFCSAPFTPHQRRVCHDRVVPQSNKHNYAHRHIKRTIRASSSAVSLEAMLIPLFVEFI